MRSRSTAGETSSPGSKRAAKRPRTSRSAPNTKRSRSTSPTIRPSPTRASAASGALLEAMRARLGWEAIEDDGRLIGLFDAKGGGAISLEPGGQFELSGAQARRHSCAGRRASRASRRRAWRGRAARHRLSRARHEPEMAARRDAADAEKPLSHHDRLHAEGRHARPRHDVPHRDGAGEPRLCERSRHGRQAARRARVAAGDDRAIRQFAVHRRRAERVFVRALRDLAPHRSRTAPACCRSPSSRAWGSSDTSITRSTCRCISSNAASTYHDVAGASFRDLMQGRLAALPGERATVSDWANHLSTIFPEVRLKRYLEMRGADVGPPDRIVAQSALMVGALLRRAALDGASELIRGWTREERQALARRGAAARARRARRRPLGARDRARHAGFGAGRPRAPSATQCGGARRNALSRSAL